MEYVELGLLLFTEPLYVTCTFRALLVASFMLISCLAYNSVLIKEAIYSSGTSVDFQRTARCCIPDDGAPYNHRCENLKWNKIYCALRYATGEDILDTRTATGQNMISVGRGVPLCVQIGPEQC
jgi:hypothetical protein